VLNFARPALAPRRWVSVADLIRQTLTLAGKQLQHCHCQVTTDLRETPPILATPEQLIQVFLNLIINAVEATHENGHIHVAARAEGDRVVIAFANDGRPIPPEHLPHIFEPFYTTKPDGTGLGLSVSHSLVRQHGGALAVENMQTGRGVVFTVTLPGAGPATEAQA